MKVECAHTELVSIDEMRPHPRNPNTHPQEQIELLAKIIKETGWRSPIVVSNRSGYVVKGHGRLAAARHAGFSLVPVDRQDYNDDAQELADLVADNRISELAEMDDGALAEILGDLHDLDFDMEVAGFEDWVPDIDSSGGLTDEDDVPPESPAICRPGQIWRLGDHRLMCGDSTDKDQIQALVNARPVDVWLTDPPYNVDYEGGTGLKIENDNMPDAEFRSFLVDAFRAAELALRPGAAFYIWHADSEGFNFRGACRDVGLQVRQCLIWNKNSLVLGRQDYQWKHEPCLYGWKSGAAHSWYGRRDKTTVQDVNDPAISLDEDGSLVVSLGETALRVTGQDVEIETLTTSVFYEEKPAASRLHPTMKPVALYTRQIEYSTVAGDIVLDSFGGSGTTVIACEKLRRCARVMEFDPKYCDVIIKRWEDFTGKKAELLDAG